MARLKNGLFGGISGRIGDVEGFIRNGIPYVRARKRKTKTQPSLKQLVQRKKMALVNAFIDSMTPFVRLGFGLQAKGEAFSANNAAKSYQLNHSLQGEYPDYSINYEAVSLTRGQLPLPADLQAIPEGNGIRFSWTYDPVTNWSAQRARTMVLVYVPDIIKSHYFLTGERMSTGRDRIELPAWLIGKELQVYLSFATENREQMSNSCYLGAVRF